MAFTVFSTHRTMDSKPTVVCDRNHADSNSNSEFLGRMVSKTESWANPGTVSGGFPRSERALNPRSGASFLDLVRDGNAASFRPWSL